VQELCDGCYKSLCIDVINRCLLGILPALTLYIAQALRTVSRSKSLQPSSSTTRFASNGQHYFAECRRPHHIFASSKAVERPCEDIYAPISCLLPEVAGRLALIRHSYNFLNTHPFCIAGWPRARSWGKDTSSLMGTWRCRPVIWHNADKLEFPSVLEISMVLIAFGYHTVKLQAWASSLL